MASSSSSSSSRQKHRLTVADVYDVAADIGEFFNRFFYLFGKLFLQSKYFFSLGKEFELVIDSHGPDHVSGLMQKVISALEHLERFAADSDAEEDALEQLRRTVSHLEREEAKRNEERQRVATVRERRSMDGGGKERKLHVSFLLQELEQVEEHYKQETRDLLSTVKRLQDENR